MSTLVGKKQKGFTIVELLIVIVVIAVLATIAIVSYSAVRSRAADSTVESDLRNLAVKIQNYYVLNGSYPTAANFTTATNDINLKISHSAYESQAFTYNLYYCAVTTGVDARFGLAARSVSLQKYAYLSPGSLQLYTGTWTANGNTAQICPGLGISATDPNLATTFGYNSSGTGWSSWTN